MSKRVFELAKEMNTTSKRLMEKLEEIHIPVKSHMSLLEDNELDRLYKHIGVVKRDRPEGSDDGNVTDQQEQPDKQARKSIPRIIRKTEIIIHDDEYYEHDISKDKDKDKDKKKNKRNSFVRTSSSTDGLMAGLQRGTDEPVPPMRKSNADTNRRPQQNEQPPVRKKPEDPKVAQNIGEGEIVGTGQKSERTRRPVDSILSIKKVSTKDEWDRRGMGEDITGSNQQDQSIDMENAGKLAQDGKTEGKEDRASIGVQKETVSAGAEKSEKHMDSEIAKVQKTDTGNTVQENLDSAGLKTENQVVQQTDAGVKEPSALHLEDKTDPSLKKPQTSENKVESVKEQPPTQAEKTQPRGVNLNRDRNSVSDSRPGRDDNRGTNQPAGSRQGPGYRGNDDRNANPNRNFNQNQNQNQNQNRGYNREGGFNRPVNRNATPGTGFNRDQNTGFNRDQNRVPNRDATQNTGFNRDQNRTGFNPNNQNRGFNRDGAVNRGPARDGEYRPYNRDGGDNRSGFDRNRDQGPRGVNDRSRPTGNRPLVIPKANIAPGQVEEKNNLRGERRTAITRDVDKTFKREAKKEQPKKEAVKAPVAIGTDKGKDKYRKSSVVGHTASVSDMFSDDFVLNEFYQEKDRLKKDRKRREAKHIPPKAVLHEITVPETITVKNLSEALKKTSAEVIKKLMGLGIMANLNQELDFDTAAIIGEEFKIKVLKEVVISDEDILFDDIEDKEEELIARAPVVVVMGHVDHGKTSLLDAIRKTDVADSEAGGITQHIGAYKVKINGRDITFLDTPGHEAFTAMRARGAQATDIAILVVAADDGVMPQTIEAINHAKAAKVTLIVAINKIDKPGANADKVKQELADHGVLIEEWGGDVIAVPVSAKKGTNIDQLLEMVLLAADVLELKANPNRQAKGIIIEAKLDKGRGPVATALVQRGTLHSGDSIISGTTFGRIRAMTDENGRNIETAGPSTPVEVIGLDEVPEAGDVFYTISDDRVAKHLIDKRKSEQREQSIGIAPRVNLEDLFSQIQQGEVKELNIIVKADVQGSVEAVKQSIEKLSIEEVKVQVIHGGVGAINEADVTLAAVANAIIIGFNVRPPANVMSAAETEGVDIRLYNIIYNAIEDIEKAMKGLLAPTFKEVIDGHIEIRQTFKASNVGTIGGGYVTDGKVFRSSDVRVVRNGIVVYQGKLGSLKRFKDDVREVAQGYECGILVDRFNDIKEGDVIEAFRMEEVART